MAPSEQEAYYLNNQASMWIFKDIILRIIDFLQPDCICEIGVDNGVLSHVLFDYVHKFNKIYIGIDPFLNRELKVKWVDEHVQWYEEQSMKVLPQLPATQLVLLDGDHNYYTVYHELQLLLQYQQLFPLVLLHDMTYPYGRRDMYYQPDHIPEASRHPYDWNKGTRLFQQGLSANGFGAVYPYATAHQEGGKANGSRTAAEDFLKEQMDGTFHFFIIPVFFGLGVLYQPKHLNPTLLDYLQKLAMASDTLHPILDSLEILRLLIGQMFQDLYDQHKELGKHSKNLEAHISNLERYGKELEEHIEKQTIYEKRLEEHTQLLQQGIMTHCLDVQGDLER